MKDLARQRRARPAVKRQAGMPEGTDRRDGDGAGFSSASAARRTGFCRDHALAAKLAFSIASPINGTMVTKDYVSYLRVSTTKQGELGVEAPREVVRRCLLGHHGEQIAECVEVESGKRSRPAAAGCGDGALPNGGQWLPAGG